MYKPFQKYRLYGVFDLKKTTVDVIEKHLSIAIHAYTRGDQKSFAIQYDVQMALAKQLHYVSM